MDIQPPAVQEALEARKPDAVLTPRDTLREVAPDVYLTHGVIGTVDEFNRGFNGNAGFVVTREGVVVIDSLGSPRLGRRWIDTIRSVTDKPIRYLILTHNHPDHSYGAVAFRRKTEAKIIAHPGTRHYLNSSQFEASVAYRKELLGSDFEGFKGVHADRVVEPAFGGPLELQLGGEVFHVYNVGGHHSFGDLLVHMPKRGITWAGDLYFQNRTTYMLDGDLDDYFKAHDLARELGTRLLIPGHGVAQEGPPFPMRRRTVSYVTRLRNMMREAVRNMSPLSRAVDKADEAFPEWEETALFEENHRKNANFVYTEMEKKILFGED
ncbi:MBL fold metallo-hydrolase [Thiohalorhabdus sp. Cl-TMA]|uniref:MBL fold metallo-hydrolase n=1 Tax=Thiohalorhabdus methylotrophus TaxID=3242694 RepID=A0ABV4TWP0_9GAMM